MPVRPSVKNMHSMAWNIAGNARKLAANAQRNAVKWLRRSLQYSTADKRHYVSVIAGLSREGLTNRLAGRFINQPVPMILTGVQVVARRLLKHLCKELMGKAIFQYAHRAEFLRQLLIL